MSLALGLEAWNTIFISLRLEHSKAQIQARCKRNVHKRRPGPPNQFFNRAQTGTSCYAKQQLASLKDKASPTAAFWGFSAELFAKI